MIVKQTLSNPNGMPCFIIPKKDYKSKHAAIVVRYGGADYIYTKPDGSRAKTPPGIAHFLEHKLFEDPNLNMFEEFSRQGAAVNAYTHFTHTVYHFNTTHAFPENLKLLFRLIQTPHFTDENVEKEKGIILSEIDMYADNPYWQMYTGLHKALFHKSPLRQDILGTKESVQSIRPAQLYDCYNHFYTPANMALICIGDFEPAQIIELSESLNLIAGSSGHDMKSGLDDSNQLVTHSHQLKGSFHSFLCKNEPACAASPFVEKTMPVSIPLFQIGFKALYNEIASPVIAAASGILSDIIAGESSPVYSHLYDLGMIDNQFSVEYIGGTDYGIFLAAGASSQPKTVLDCILQTIESTKRQGIDRNRFEVIKNKHIGRYIRGFNSIETLSNIQADLFTKDQNISEVLEAFHQVKLEDVEMQLHAHLSEKNCALSTIQPQRGMT